MSELLSPQDALVATMVAMSASDANLSTPELISIERIVDHLPVFAGYDVAHIPVVSRIVIELFEEEDGIEALFGIVREALPEDLYETAYAMACDVAAADGRINESELRLLEEMRYELNLDRLHAAAIERAAGARHKRLHSETA